MTEEACQEFFKKRSDLKFIEMRIESLKERLSEEQSKNIQLCDHKYPEGGMAGPKFQGSYCGFMCAICECSISYESMGY